MDDKDLKRQKRNLALTGNTKGTIKGVCFGDIVDVPVEGADDPVDDEDIDTDPTRREPGNLFDSVDSVGRIRRRRHDL